ncbi:MAG: PLDc_N domain-containing protein, partial [Clostridia bacterium]|nr:PLDc_N domain-containing protein [Clostridia bacterium]
MKKRANRQKGERRIAAALRIVLVAVLLVLQVGFVVLLSRYLKENASFVYLLLEICALGLVIHIHNRPGSQSYKIGWVVSVLALPVIGCILYFL